jgi:tetratricopeptide (TPR) repeat protein
VELVKAMRDRGDLVRDAEGCWVEGPTLDWTALPERVEGVVEERIARLDVELQELLLVCSVEGEEFTAEVASRVQGLDELSTVRFLSAELEDQHRLVNAEGLVRIGSLQLSRYRFAHTLLQQYLYGTLDPVQRSYMNQAVGQALETLFGDQTAPLAAKLARHFEEAGLPAKAAGYRLEAAQRAHQMSAHDEAVAHLNEGLDLLADQPKDIPRRELELQLQTALATVLSVAQGYASPNVAQAYSRARDLSRELGDPPLAVPALYGLCAYHFVRSELEQAYQEGEQLLKLTESADDAGYWLGAQLVLGAAAMHLGQHDRARQHLEATIDRYDPVEHRLVAHHLGHDPAVGAFSYMALVLQVQGYPGQATQAMESALALAQELDHPYSRGYAASFAAMLLQLQRRLSECYELAKEALQIGRDRRFPLWQAIGDMSRGWVMSQRGRGEAGIAELAQGLATWEGSGAVLALPFQRTLLAEAFLRAGERDKGLQALAGSFCCPQDVWWRPEQHRLYAELLLLVPGHEAQATASLQQALALAEESQARFLELRAAMSLSRLLHQQGRTNEAYDLLASRYAWFREGFETPDLKQARELLDLVRRDAEGDGGLSGSERTGEGMSEAELAGDPARRSETPLAAGPTANRSGTPAIRMEA